MKKVKLVNLFLYIRNGANIKQGMENTGYPITRIETISNRKVDRNKMGYAGITNLEKYSDYILQDGDILMSHINSETHLGKVALYCKEDNETIIHGMNLLLLRPKKDLIVSKYAFYYLSSQSFLRQIPNITKKSVNQASFTVTALKDLSIPMVSITEQKAIAEKLDKVSELIEKRKAQLEKLDLLIKSRFIEMFDGKYSTQSLESVCEELFAGGDVKKDKSSNEQSDRYPYPIYTNGEKDNGLYGYTSLVRVKKEAVTISGRGTIGFTCLRTEPFYPAVRLIVAVPNQKIISGCYLQYFIQSKNYGGQGASIPQLTVPMIKNEKIPVPPIELQNKFAELVKLIDKSKFEIQKSLEKLEILKKSLMQQYFG